MQTDCQTNDHIKHQASDQTEQQTNYILGISAFYHDSAAALISEGHIVAAAQEERFTRIKHDPAFPVQAIEYCLAQADITLEQVNSIVFYDKPFLSFDRLLETYFSFAPQGFRSFLTSMPIWLKEKLSLKGLLRKELCALADCSRDALPQLLFTEHHQSHAASAFYPSPFDEAAVLCLDGVGEWATTSAWHGKGSQLEPLWQINFPHSLGLLYSAFTQYCGFKVNSGEYKLMGLAPYGTPCYVDLIQESLIDIHDDGSFQLRLEYFDYCTGSTMTSSAFHTLFGGPPREAEAPITQRELDIAASIQQVTETIVLKLANTLQQETGLKKLCLAGGVALNCSANGKLLQSNIFDEIWVQPAAGDAGGALGAALAGHYFYHQQPRTPQAQDAMQGAYLGPAFSDQAIINELDTMGASYQRLDDEQLFDYCASHIANGQVIGWFQGRMEFGPRALGNRSILADPRNPDMQSKLNQKIKFRESFRPFAPSVLQEAQQQYFKIEAASPYMLMVAPIQESIRHANSDQAMASREGIDKLYCPRSTLPAVTHVDYSARLQTVTEKTNARYHQLLTAFQDLTGCGVLINTSFNVRGEPIVGSPTDAFHCFMNTDMDRLVINNFVLEKEQQNTAVTLDKHRIFAPD